MKNYQHLALKEVVQYLEVKGGKEGKSFSQLKRGGTEGNGTAQDIGGTDNNSTDCQ